MPAAGACGKRHQARIHRALVEMIEAECSVINGGGEDIFRAEACLYAVGGRCHDERGIGARRIGEGDAVYVVGPQPFAVQILAERGDRMGGCAAGIGFQRQAG